ncbi:hypothetical protein MJ585_11595 [Klebsiella pneumoniae]|nr:hypothetical protein MJ585_11595 [Klebsiella pneumoniae]
MAAEDNCAGGVDISFPAPLVRRFTEKDALQLHKSHHMIEDAGDRDLQREREHMRIRPFAFYGRLIPHTTEQDKLAKNGPYPSGHTLSLATAW